jgi:hypothetical protein
VGRESARRRHLALFAAVIGAFAGPILVAACGSGDQTNAGGTGAGPTIDASASGGGGSGAGPADSGPHHDAAVHHDAAADHDDGDARDDGDAACGTLEMGYPLAPGIHVPICSYISWPDNPPTSGEHYPIWAAYRAFDKPVPRGFYVHDMEHGGIVIAYNCPLGCDDEVARLETWLAARPADPTCTAPVHARVVVTPDPLLDVRFAAVAWGFSLKGDCFDLDALGPFIDAHYRQGPEDFCDDGIDPTAPDAGLPDDCGDPPG